MATCSDQTKQVPHQEEVQVTILRSTDHQETHLARASRTGTSIKREEMVKAFQALEMEEVEAEEDQEETYQELRQGRNWMQHSVSLTTKT